MSKFQTKYGYFSDDGGEYIITDFKTPKPWVNVLSNGSYGLIISQVGGGFSWDTHSEFNRINRWHQDLIKDDWGKYFYIKNNKTNEIFSPTWMPIKTELDNYKCTYGLGYTKFNSVYKNIEIELTIFIPFDETLEIWNFQIKNNSNEDLDLSIYSYFEWCLGSSADHHREFHKLFVETDFDDNLNAMLATKRLWEIPLSKRGHWNIEYPYLGFISSNKKIVDYDGDKETFIGQYGSINKPNGLFQNKLDKRIGKWNDSIATVKVNLNIKANESDDVAFYIGLKDSREKIQSSLNQFKSKEQIKDSLENVKQRWNDLLNPLEVNTPDESLNFLVNKWLRYQAIAGRLWARTGYYQQSGAFGFRDQLQDSLVFLPIDPSQTEKQIRLHSRHQKEDGSVLHWWHPITDTGLETEMTDDLLWLPFVIIQYLDETNNYSFLNEKEYYYDNKSKDDTLFNHCVASIEKVLTRYSERGLPLIGAGDWNDGLSAVGLDMKGESIWLAEFFYYILKRFASIAEVFGEKQLVERYQIKAQELKESFDKYAWDGDWYFRATKDTGEKIGSKENQEGKIYLNAQTWSVISNIAPDDKQKLAMKSVEKYLLKDNGTLLLSPAYSIPDENIGYLSRYAPGKRENGGVYTHAATWSIWAFSLIKKDDLVYEIFKRLSPIYNGLDPDKYVAEPYVTPGNIDGPESPNYGMAGWSWYTGSASWFQKVIVDWLLGIRAAKDGLIIDPCIPKEWKEFTVKRKYRGCIYHITVFNPEKISYGVKYIKIGNTKFEGNIIKPQNIKEISVEVYLGKITQLKVNRPQYVKEEES